jgi:putative ABC transport system substrate-binding protein
MKRRDFITFVEGVAGSVTMPLAAPAQQLALATIGVLVTGNPNPEPFLQGLREGLREAGYVEGRNIQLENPLLRRAKPPFCWRRRPSWFA